MKSKRVDVFLMDNSFDPDDYCGSEINSGSVVQIDNARKAVELAEEDARARAIKAVCLTFCRCQKPCQYPNDCEKKDLFLENYKKS